MKNIIFLLGVAYLLLSACTQPADTGASIPGAGGDSVNMRIRSLDDSARRPTLINLLPSGNTPDGEIVIAPVAAPVYNFLWATGSEMGTMERGNGWTSGTAINESRYGSYVEGLAIKKYALENKARLLNTNRQPKDVIDDILSVTRSLDIAMTWGVRNNRQNKDYYLAIVEQVAITQAMVTEVINAYDQATAQQPMRVRSNLKDYENLLVGLEMQLKNFLDPRDTQYLVFVHPDRREGVANKAPATIAIALAAW